MARNPDWTEDEVVLAIDLLQRLDGRVPEDTSDAMLDLSRRLQALPIHPLTIRKPNFRSPSSVRLKCFNLLANEPGLYAAKNLVATNVEVWRRYWKDPKAVAARVSQIGEAARAIASSHLAVDEVDEALQEGGLVLRAHRVRERHPGLRKKVLSHLRKTKTAIACAGCRITEGDYDSLGAIAERVFEVHHIQPLGRRGHASVSTTVRDVVLLCANCHRLIHGLIAREQRIVTVEEMQHLLPQG